MEKAVEEVQKYCGSDPGPLAITKVFPNPLQDESMIQFEFAFPDAKEYDLKIYNALGQRIISQQIIPSRFDLNRINVDMSTHSAGVYFMTIENASGIEATSFLKL